MYVVMVISSPRPRRFTPVHRVASAPVDLLRSSRLRTPPSTAAFPLSSFPVQQGLSLDSYVFFGVSNTRPLHCFRVIFASTRSLTLRRFIASIMPLRTAVVDYRCGSCGSTVAGPLAQSKCDPYLTVHSKNHSPFINLDQFRK